MATAQTIVTAKPQLIPTNAGERTFATPPQAMQENIVPNDLFYIRNHWKGAPDIDVDAYRLSVDGEVERPLSLSLGELRKLPLKRFQVTFECCGNSMVPDYWAKKTRAAMEQLKGHGIMGNAEWAGVSLRDVLEMAGVKDSAVEVLFEGADHGPDEVNGDPPEVTYERSVPVAKSMHPDTLLAFEMNGEPLPPMHGYPLRLLVPGWYGMTSVKWLVGIHVIDHEFQGLYQKERYMVLAGPDSGSFYKYHTEMMVKSIITAPAPGETVRAGEAYNVGGAAWSGEIEIARVEVSSDGGRTWEDADVMPRSGYSWHRWSYNWRAPAPGGYTLMSRATNVKGEVQPKEFPNQWDGHNYGNNMVFPHEVQVTES